MLGLSNQVVIILIADCCKKLQPKKKFPSGQLAVPAVTDEEEERDNTEG